MYLFHRKRIAQAVAVLLLMARQAGAQTPEASATPSSGAATSIVAATNSMEVLDGDRKLRMGDRLSYRVVEERKPPVGVVVADSGEVELPLIGRVPAAGKTCRELAYSIKGPLERDYFFKATVIIGLDVEGQRSQGRVYITGQVKTQGAIEIPPGEGFTVSKAILAAGGLMDFADKRKVRLMRSKGADTETIIVDLKEVIDRGRSEKDPVVKSDDRIYVPEKLVNF